MIAIYDWRLSVSRSLPGVFLLLFTFTSQAAFVFTGQNIDVTFSETGYTDLTDSIVAGSSDPDPDISYLDGSFIGNGIMLDFEFIDFADNAVTFQLRGDGSTDASGYQSTASTGRYILSLAAADFSISNISIGSVTAMTGVSVGSEVTFDANNIYFDISTLGILETAAIADTGSLTLNVEFVPVPAAFLLMLSGLSGLVLFSLRRKTEKI